MIDRLVHLLWRIFPSWLGSRINFEAFLSPAGRGMLSARRKTVTLESLETLSRNAMLLKVARLDYGSGRIGDSIQVRRPTMTRQSL